MFKSLAAAALISLSSLSAAPAFARPSTCWMSDGSPSGRMPAAYCDVHRRINSNGHTVFDIRWNDGSNITVVLWDNMTAEVIFPGNTVKVFNTYFDSRGDIRLVGKRGFEFSFRT